MEKNSNYHHSYVNDADNGNVNENNSYNDDDKDDNDRDGKFHDYDKNIDHY